MVPFPFLSPDWLTAACCCWAPSSPHSRPTSFLFFVGGELELQWPSSTDSARDIWEEQRVWCHRTSGFNLNPWKLPHSLVHAERSPKRDEMQRILQNYPRKSQVKISADSLCGCDKKARVGRNSRAAVQCGPGGQAACGVPGGQRRGNSCNCSRDGRGAAGPGRRGDHGRHLRGRPQLSPRSRKAGVHPTGRWLLGFIKWRWNLFTLLNTLWGKTDLALTAWQFPWDLLRICSYIPYEPTSIRKSGSLL